MKVLHYAVLLIWLAFVTTNSVFASKIEFSPHQSKSTESLYKSSHFHLNNYCSKETTVEYNKVNDSQIDELNVPNSLHLSNTYISSNNFNLADRRLGIPIEKIIFPFHSFW